MPVLDKLSIMGVRSFGCEERDRAVIPFTSPVTLILGQNGTGKTTIIECLKYATTGEKPPNSAKDASFIHDPKLCDQTEVKAQVKLSFNDVKGNKVVVTRCMLATQKMKKVTAKTVSSCIQRQRDDGQLDTIDTRCTDVDKEMTSLMGVSKAVLNNVIFCHQEDSNWPLSEGKSLKVKFDEIFAATRYVKALELIRAKSKTEGQNMKSLDLEINYLIENKERADKIKADLEKNEIRLAECRDTVAVITNRMAPLGTRLQQIALQEANFSKIHAEIIKRESRHNEMNKICGELRQKIVTLFDGSTFELEQTLSDFQKEVKSSREKITHLEGSIETVQKSYSNLNAKKNKLMLVFGQQKADVEQNNQRLSARSEKLRSGFREYSLSGLAPTGDLSESVTQQGVAKLEQKVSVFEADITTFKNEFESKEKDAQCQVDAVMKKKIGLQQTEQTKSDSLRKARIDLRDCQQELSQIDASGPRLAEVSENLQDAKDSLEAATAKLDPLKLRNDMQAQQRSIATAEYELKSLDEELTNMQRESSVQTEVELCKKDRTGKDEAARRLVEQHKATLSTTLGFLPTENFRSAVDAYVQKQRSNVDKNKRTMSENKERLSALNSKRDLISENCNKFKADIHRLEMELMEVSADGELENRICRIKDDMEKDVKFNNTTNGMQEFYEGVIKSLQTKGAKACCPICKRGWEDNCRSSEVLKIVERLQESINCLPGKKKEIDAKQRKNTVELDKLLSLRPKMALLVELREGELPKLQAEIKRLDGEMAPIKTRIEELADVIEHNEDEESMARITLGDMSVIDQNMEEVKKLDRRIAAASARLSCNTFTRTFEQARGEKEQKQTQLDFARRQLDQKQSELQRYNDEVNILSKQVNELQAERLNLQQQMQKRTQLDSKKLELSELMTSLNADLAEIRTQMRPVEDELELAQKAKSKVVRDKESGLDELKRKLDSIRSIVKEINSLTSEIERFNQAGGQTAMARTEKELSSVDENLRRDQEKITEQTVELDALRQDLASRQTRERDLRDNLELKHKEAEVESLTKQIEELKRKYGDLDITGIANEKRKLLDEEQSLHKKKSEAEGRLQELKDVAINLKTDFEKDSLKNAHKKLSDKQIDLEVTKTSVKDLTKYYHALDKAVMTYHANQMAEVNKILKLLWIQTYKRADIDYVEIRSSDADDDNELPDANLDKRRTYNYKVVSVRNGQTVDMRGRCSAGQRVLCCLLIRMALAETFCANCGILALDEPTTNLDQDNRDGLAEGLKELINARSGSRMQLIVITHDEEFIDNLSTGDVRNYIQVQKNNRGVSEIRRVKI